jgi:AcrR family transcriptional regulator
MGRGREATVNRVKYGVDWEPTVVEWSSTRGRILLAAASLFARRGYFGTSTRDIAEAVNIRQPSLFHHFEAKHTVFRTLVGMDLGPSIDRLQCRLVEDCTWAEKLHLTVARDVRVALLQPFDSRGLYQDAVLSQPEFATEREGIALFHQLMERLIVGGQDAGEFETLREQGGPSGPVRHARPLQAGDFVLRAVLVDPASLAEVREVTHRRLDDFEGATVG